MAKYNHDHKSKLESLEEMSVLFIDAMNRGSGIYFKDSVKFEEVCICKQFTLKGTKAYHYHGCIELRQLYKRALNSLPDGYANLKNKIQG